MDFSFLNIKELEPVDLQKWAEIAIQKWQFNIVQKNLVYSGDLLRSFEATVSGEANGNAALINFAFNFYIRMLEMGVGKGVGIGAQSTRRRYPVFTRTFRAEVYRLSELLAQMYANHGAGAIAYSIMD